MPSGSRRQQRSCRRTLLSDRASNAMLISVFNRKRLLLTTVLLMSVIRLSAICRAQDARRQSAKFSTLSPSQQSQIEAAIEKWNHEFKWKAGQAVELAQALVDTIQLGPDDEKDLVITDRSGCSPTGNCPVFVLRPAHGEYRVVLDGIGQSVAVDRTAAHGFRDVILRMHGSATESTVKSYRFNGTRYVRVACYNEIFADLDSNGNLQQLAEPRRAPCHAAK